VNSNLPQGNLFAFDATMPGQPKRFVYLLRSERDFTRPYVGLTSNVDERLRAHNAGQNPSTASYRPWELVVALEFKTEKVAMSFERYLKSGSARAFAKRHFRG